MYIKKFLYIIKICFEMYITLIFVTCRNADHNRMHFVAPVSFFDSQYVITLVYVYSFTTIKIK